VTRLGGILDLSEQAYAGCMIDEGAIRYRWETVGCKLDERGRTMDALVPPFGRGMISEGAVILFDDWNCNRANPAFGERRAWREYPGGFGSADDPQKARTVGGSFVTFLQNCLAIKNR
jgi:hypothetical protein